MTTEDSLPPETPGPEHHAPEPGSPEAAWRAEDAPAEVQAGTADAPAPAEDPAPAKPINGTPVVVESDVQVGDTVLFSLDIERCDSVNRIFMRHTIVGLGLPQGGAHTEGQLLPMIVTKVNADGTLNGQILLDGNCSVWGLNIPEGDTPGTWQ